MEDRMMHRAHPSLVVVVLLLAALLSVVVPSASAATIVARPVRLNLEFPAAFTVAPDGRIFYGERFTGEIHIYNPATGTDTLFFDVPGVPPPPTSSGGGALGPAHVAGGEQGLLGLALHPHYPSNPKVYAFVTREAPGGHENHIIRLTDSGGKGTAMWVMFRIPSVALFHNGGRMLFGPDRKLYVVVGDNASNRNAQDLSVPYGKILRMEPWGAVPPDNPFPNNRVWAYGIRNGFGFDFDPVTGRLWETQNGPQCNDELNRIIKGMNYGWGPRATCSTPPMPPLNTNRDGPSPVLPLRWYSPPIAPTGAVFCTGCDLGTASEGTLFFGAFNGGHVRRVTLNGARLSVASQTVVFKHRIGIISMEAGPDGTLYVSDRSGIYRLVLM
jgi:glucose/arabinose dehydrogenase